LSGNKANHAFTARSLVGGHFAPEKHEVIRTDVFYVLLLCIWSYL